MRSVSITDLTGEMNPFEMDLNEENCYNYMNDSKLRLQESAKKLGLKSSLDDIAEGAGFSSRKIISYYFGTRKDLFKSIGVETKSPRDRLVEATKILPYNASSREIAYKAGYKSHKIINLYFSSLEALKRESGKYFCNKERILFEGVEFSPQDISKGVTIPEEINELVAEEAGWHAGDGSLPASKKPSYVYKLGGDPKEEKEFYEYVKKVFKQVYHLEVAPQSLSGGKLYGVTFSSKAIYTYKNKFLGFPIGRKTETVEMPPQIINSKKEIIKCAFIRGLADTDFGLSFKKSRKEKHSYPYIRGTLNSKKLIEQVAKILVELGFRVGRETRKRYKNPQHTIKILGATQLEKWIEKISFSNPKHMTKYLVWKKFGFCPVKTTVQERKLMLKNKLDPNSFYGEKKNA